mgnify:CR=1 FL=1
MPKKIKHIKKKVLKKIEVKELIIKTKPEWVKGALVNKAKYQKKYSDSIKNSYPNDKTLQEKYLESQKLVASTLVIVKVPPTVLSGTGTPPKSVSNQSHTKS